MWEDMKEEKRQWNCNLFGRLSENKFVIKKKILLFLFFAIIISMIQQGREKHAEWQEANSGVPDVVSSKIMGNDHYLVVVANCSRIEDKEEFAREIIRMCQENSFHSLRFSTDMNGYPSGLEITVYLNRKNVEEGKPVCKIKFLANDDRGDYDIKNDEDRFRLYLDGKEIDFS